MQNKIATNILANTNVTIVFKVVDVLGKTKTFSRTLSGIKEDVTPEEILTAATAVSSLYEHDSFEVKLVTTNLIEDDGNSRQEFEVEKSQSLF